MKSTSYKVFGQDRELGWWAQSLVSLLTIPAVLLCALACVLMVVVLLLVVGALVAIAPAAMIAWKLSKRKESRRGFCLE